MKRKKNMQVYQNLALISQIGISMILPIFLCLWFGQWLDKKIGTSPLFLIVFLVLGIMSAFRNLFKMTKKQTKNDEEEEDE
jgi:F0F1-type ATP synthase assembly protein I